MGKNAYKDGQQSSALGRQARRNDNDWLTVLAMPGIFFFHCARFFNYEDWHVKNKQLSAGRGYHRYDIAQCLSAAGDVVVSAAGGIISAITM